MDHCAFFIEEDGDLVSGDTVLGFGTTFFRVLDDYMTSLHRMLACRCVSTFTSRHWHHACRFEPLFRVVADYMTSCHCAWLGVVDVSRCPHSP